MTDTLPKRPRGLRTFCAILLGIGIVNLGTALRTLQMSADYSALHVSFPPALQAIFGLGWGLGFIWASRAVWSLRNGSGRTVLLLVGAYGGYQVIWWRVFVRSDYALVRWPFAVLVVVLFVASVYWYISQLSI